jgi:glyoxylase-like metal-dependent hydrolase (beta-lactamase superfamily II)
VPGHTAGSTAFLFPDHGVAFTGDALVTWDPVVGRTGPCLICRAFTQDSGRALASLQALAGLDARLTLTGHGPTWPGTPAEAVRQARATGIA